MTEFEARTVQEAIAKGLAALGLSEDEASIEILEEGRSGVLGVGGKAAVVHIAPKAKAAPAPEPEPAVTTEDAAQPDPVSALAPSEQDESRQVIAVSAEFLQGILQRMGLNAGVETEVLAGEDEITYRLNITGEDLGILIGRRAETLDAFQYLTRLVVNQHTHRWHRIEVDVENYKQRRQQSLQRLARSMADRAVSEGRTIVLEPMPPRERRLVHLALKDREDVYTESIGEGDERKVTIIPA